MNPLMEILQWSGFEKKMMLDKNCSMLLFWIPKGKQDTYVNLILSVSTLQVDVNPMLVDVGQYGHILHPVLGQIA